MAGNYTQYDDFHFSSIDYIVFVLMILFSTGIGIYFAYLKRPASKEENVEGHRKTNFGSERMNEYLLGSRKLRIFPVAMSLVGSYISGVTILGTSSEIYNYGTQYWLIVLPIICHGFVICFIYLPVFSILGVGSSYEYLEMRFNSTVRSFVSFMFIMDEIFFLPMIVYVPGIAFSQVTGINLYFICTVICVICVIYTIIGGIKAVVHTDAWQILVMFISVVVVVTLGTIAAGGVGNVFDTANEGGRLVFFNFNPSPYERQTFWSVLIGGFTYWTSFNSVNQTMVQRYMSLPTLKNSRKSVCIFVTGMVVFVSLCCYAGLLIYHFYKDCDPLTAGLIKNDDQLLPIYVMSTISDYKGIPGLFIAGVFGAALSSLSVVLNSTALVLLEDIVRGCFKLKLSERVATIFVKSSILVLGTIALLLIFVLEKLSGILSVATSLTAIAASTSFGVFTLGMLVPWCTSKGALSGGLAGVLMAAWVSFGTQYAVASKQVIPPRLDISVDACPGNVTAPEPIFPHDESGVFPLYRLSFLWINPIGIFVTVAVGTLVSFITGPMDIKKLDGDLISPVIHKFLPKECFPPPGTERYIRQDNTAMHLLNSENAAGPTKF